MILSTSLAAICGSSLPPVNDPQPFVARGMFSTFPAVVIGEAAGQPSAGLTIKSGGDQLAPPQPLPTSSVNYSALNQLTTTSGSTVEFDAISSGNVVFPGLDTNGRMTLNARWFGLSVSVTNQSLGAPRSALHAARNRDGQPGSEIVTYYFPGSQGLAGVLPGSTYSEMSRGHLGFGATSDFDLNGLDFGMASTLEGGDGSQFFDESESFYFSVSPAWALTHQGEDFYAAGTAYMHPFPDPRSIPAADMSAHPADIYYVQWMPANSQEPAGWSTPILCAGWQDLGFLPPQNTLEGDLRDVFGGNLDAIVVNPGLDAVIYSADPGGLDASAVQEGSQLMFSYFPVAGSSQLPTALRDTNDRKVAKKLGTRDNVEGDDIDGACGIDPHSGVTTELYREFGRPIGTFNDVGTPLGLSSVRALATNPVDGVTSHSLIVQVTGWAAAYPQAVDVRLWITDQSWTQKPSRPGSHGPKGWINVRTKTRAATENSTEFIVHQLLDPAAGNERLIYAELVSPTGAFLAGSWVSGMIF